MKKLLLVFLMCFVSWSVYGAITMCAQNDAIIIPNGNYSMQTGTYSGYMWTSKISHGNIMGISTCLPSNYDKSNYNPKPDLEAEPGLEAGQYCWCKALHPAVSNWVYNSNRGSASTCVSECAKRCAQDFVDARYCWGMHYYLFDSVANQ